MNSQTTISDSAMPAVQTAAAVVAQTNSLARFSVCIPNFNYARYIGETIRSVLEQTHASLEVLVSDNASTDDSVTVVRAIDDPRIKLHVNRCNVGFAGNLLKAAAMATGDWMLMLSSDDGMTPAALATYQKLIDALGADAAKTIFGAGLDVIDGDGRSKGYRGWNAKPWSGASKDEKLSALVGADVYTLPADQLLRQSLNYLRTPFRFASMAYPKALHDKVESYSQGGLINPDKRFAWSLLEHAKLCVFVDAPLFRYREHANNQNALQAKQGAIKLHIDEYVATINLPQSTLDAAGVDRDWFIASFVEEDIALRGLKALADGQPELARRILRFGQATYPKMVRRNRKVLALSVLLGLGPVGRKLAASMKDIGLQRWEQKNERNAGRRQP